MVPTRRLVTPPPAEFPMQAPTPMLTARTFVVICYISVAPWIQFHEYILPQHEDERCTSPLGFGS